jgi:hypothetical protein
MRAQAARDGRACAQAHPDDHGGDSPEGRRWGVGIAARVDGGSWRAGGCLLHSLLVAPFCARVRRVLSGSGERCGGVRVTRFGAARTNACSCVVTYDHARRARFPIKPPPSVAFACAVVTGPPCQPSCEGGKRLHRCRGSRPVRDQLAAKSWRHPAVSARFGCCAGTPLCQRGLCSTSSASHSDKKSALSKGTVGSRVVILKTSRSIGTNERTLEPEPAHDPPFPTRGPLRVPAGSDHRLSTAAPQSWRGLTFRPGLLIAQSHPTTRKMTPVLARQHRPSTIGQPHFSLAPRTSTPP